MEDFEVDIIRHYGYTAEVHDVTTSDGHILEVHRIPRGRNDSNNSAEQRPVVFLQHGFIGSSAVWVTNEPENSAGFLLADAGFDVWMGNARGNKYSRDHERYARDDDEYWAFTWDELSKYDLPAMIDYALNETHQRDLYYIGYSEGTLTMFAKLASDQTFARKIRLFFALGPIGALTHIQGLIRTLATTMLLPLKERLPVYMTHLPSGTSTANLLHWAQMVNSGKVQMYDFGSDSRNRYHYSSTEVPVYNLSLVNAPVYLYWSDADWLADKQDVQESLLGVIPSRYIKQNNELQNFNHFDFIWGKNAPSEIYRPIIELIKDDERIIRIYPAEGSLLL